jgi:hypothetical protein
MNSIRLLSPILSRGPCLGRPRLSYGENPRRRSPLRHNRKRVNTDSATQERVPSDGSSVPLRPHASRSMRRSTQHFCGGERSSLPSATMLRAALPCLVLAISLTHARMQLRYNACLPYGPETRSFVLTDSDHDGLGEFCYTAWSDMFHPFWAIAEYRPVDRYEIVQADTGIYPYPSSLLLGNFVPHDVADLDRDGKTELVGEVFSYDTITPAPRKDVCTVESRDSLSLPDTLTWHYADTYDPNGIGNRHVTDLDQDSVLEITTTWDPAAIAIFENVGDDQDSLVFYHSSPYYYAKPRTWGDFDQNGKMELVADAYGAEHIFECTGDNQYAEVCSLGPVRTNQNDWFTGRDADRNGKPEFFVVYGDGWNKVWLYMFEAVAEHQETGPKK